MNKLYVVGIGPGAYEKMTIEAAQALKNSDVIIGLYRVCRPGKRAFSGKRVYDYSNEKRGRTVPDGF